MTSDSMSARPMIIARRIGPAALGLRAMPSTDAAMARDWPMAPAAAATPRTNAAPMTPQRTPVRAGSTWPNAEKAVSTRSTNSRMCFLFTRFLLPFRNVAKVVFLKSVFFCRGGATDVHHRQHDEDERLQERPEDAQAHHRPGQHEWQHAHEDAGGGVLAEDVPEE